MTVVNQLGMHARAAAKFVHLAGRYKADVRVAREAREMDGKSMMGVLLLAAPCGSTITISAAGTDEHDAVEALVALVQSGFGEQAPAPKTKDDARGARERGPASGGT